MIKHRVLTIFLLSFFCLMLLYPKTVFLGASEGLLLWFQTVLPTLLPYMILNNLMIHTSALQWICRVAAPVLCRIFATSYYGSFAVLSGFLCGYPIGAKTTSDLLKKGQVMVNGEVVKKPELKINETTDQILCQGKKASYQKNIYLIL